MHILPHTTYMEISSDIEIREASLWLKAEKILILNDLHLGYEESLHRKGILVPKFQLQEIIQSLERILRHIHPDKIIINGDLKHEFGTVLKQEWKEVLEFLDYLLTKTKEIIIIQGNHDPLIKPITKKRNITVLSQFQVGETIIVHGDKIIETNAKRIIIGHEHPAITLKAGSKWEKYKCFLKGKWKGKELIAIPSFNPLLEGTDILKEQVLSPYLTNIKSFQVFIISKGEVFEFGKVKEILKKCF